MAVLANYRSLSRQFFVFNYIPVAHRSAIGVPRGMVGCACYSHLFAIGRQKVPHPQQKGAVKSQLPECQKSLA